MKITTRLWAILSILVVTIACKKDNPPSPFNAISAEVTEVDLLRIVFDAAPDAQSASDPANYSLERTEDSDPTHPMSVKVEGAVVLLKFSERFATDTYVLRFVEGSLQSTEGGKLSNTQLEFNYEAPIKYKEVKNIKVSESVIATAAENDMTNPAGYWYFNLDEGKVVDPDEVMTKKWDVAFFPNPNILAWTINNGSYYDVAANNWFFGPGAEGTAGFVMLFKSFDEVTTVPEDTDFHAAGRQPFFAYDYGSIMPGWYDAGISQTFQIVEPVRNRTILIQTNKGNYAKMEIQSIYKDNPDNPTKDSEKYYLHFRYFVQEDGTTNLDTSD